MKKIFLTVCCVLLCLTSYSKPKHHVHRHSSRPVVHHRHGPYKHHHSHHSHHKHNHYGSFITGAVVGGLVTSILTPSQPVIVTTPVTTVQQTKQVWVPGKWIITRDIHGNEIKTWQPGYYITVPL